MSNGKSSAVPTDQSTALATIGLDPQSLIATAIEKGSGIEVLERLFAVAKEAQELRARQAWYSAMAEFQRSCPAVRKTSTANVRTRTGSNFSYTFASLDEIMSTITPIMGPLGLSVSYRVKHDGSRVIASARVSHEMGHHEESGEVPVPIDAESGMGASAAQRIGIASSYAKRYALLAITGLAPQDEADDDGNSSAGVAMPRRASEASAAPAAGQIMEAHSWTGKIVKVAERTGKTNDKAWKLFLVQTADAQEFSTFDTEHAKFAREAGSSLVQIAWEKTPKGSLKILSIGPPEEPVDDETARQDLGI